jgi:hypothetical protein
MSAYPISLSAISVSADKTLPHGFTELRGTLFTDGTSIPASGTIRFTDFLNKTIGAPWEIIMKTDGTKTTSSASSFGNPGTSTWQSCTASSTGANGRTAIGDAVGLYNAFFTKTGITKVALVSGDGSISDPTSHSHYIVYDLVSSGTGSESLNQIIKRLDTATRNNFTGVANWGRDDSRFQSSSVTDFTGGVNGYSGTSSVASSQSGGNFQTNTGTTFPDKFCIWGINNDSDNDTQVLCAYSGTLANGNGKSDSWRNNNPSHTFWSYWGNDWHSTNADQTIGAAKQTDPGIASGARGYNSTVYLMAF